MKKKNLLQRLTITFNQRKKQKKSPLREAIETIVWSLVIALLIIHFVVQSFYIPSSSMEPTLVPGERVLVAKFYYR